MATAVQDTYQENLTAAQVGQLNGCDYDVESGIVEEANGIAFGLAVAQGTADKGIIIGGTTTTFRGASVRDVTLGAETDSYAENANIGVVTRGVVWVSPSAAVSANDAVYFTAATGRFTNVSGGNVLVKGARWVDSASQDGLARIKLSGLFRGVDA
jgi:hypothetical protein